MVDKKLVNEVYMLISIMPFHMSRLELKQVMVRKKIYFHLTEIICVWYVSMEEVYLLILSLLV